MPAWEFPGSDPIEAFIDMPAGRVALIAKPASATTVELSLLGPGWRGDRLTSEVRVTFDNGRLEITGPKHAGLWRALTGFDLTVTLPPRSRCTLRTASADVSCTGDVDYLDVHTASGDVTVGAAVGFAQAQTASGDVRLEEVWVGADVRTASGDVRLARAGGDVRVRTASGDVSIGNAGGSVTVVTAGGDVRLARVATGRVDVATASGDVVVAVARGAGVYLDLASVTGSATSQLDEAEPSDEMPLEVKCRTASGDIRITRSRVTEDQRRDPPPGPTAAGPADEDGPAHADGPEPSAGPARANGTA
jgi:hypothetical protein